MGREWSDGHRYEDFMGRWSRPLAKEFVRWLGVPEGGHWLDVGTGTGALASAICASARPAGVTACDPSVPFLELARERLVDPRVRFEAAAVDDLPRRTGGYDAVVSALALNFFPDPVAALEKQVDRVRPGGVIGAAVWDYGEGMEFLRHFWDAAVAVRSQAVEMDEGRRFSVCDPKVLESLLTSVGVVRVRSVSLRVPTVFTTFEDYWRPFLGGTGPAPRFVNSLSEEGRAALVSELKSRLSAEDGGPIELEARAWAVAGRRSE